MKKLKRILKVMFVASAVFSILGTTACKEKNSNPEANEFTATIFTDVHHGDFNYNDFKCTNALRKLQKIIDETPNSDFYINLGDMVDYLKNGKVTFYEEVAAKLRENNLNIYNVEGKNYVEGNRMVYNVLGNHETAYVPKADLKEFIPYVEGVGCVYSFQIKDVLFVSIDANFDRETQSDEPAIMRGSTKFTIPQKVISWAKEEVKSKINDSVKGIVWLSHIAFKDIDNTSRFELVDALNEYGLPLTIFEGHTHSEAYYRWYDDADETKTIASVYTLPAVTTAETYKYYNVTFSNGTVKEIDKHLTDTIELI
ncbi:MAG: metallophosphoesterase [Clostridia bacterium]|nr:metallophosphoesterase [Clostridia bacterium]